MKVEFRAEPLDALFENGEGSDVHFNLWTSECLEGQSQDRVCLAALRVRHEQDLSDMGVKVAALSVHSGMNMVRGSRI